MLALFMVILSRERSETAYRDASKPYVVIVDLTDDKGWDEISAIQKNLESQTYQKVYPELVDENRKVYRLRVNCPPSKINNIWNWLSGRNWVEHAEIQR